MTNERLTFLRALGECEVEDVCGLRRHMVGFLRLHQLLRLLQQLVLQQRRLSSKGKREKREREKKIEEQKWRKI